MKIDTEKSLTSESHSASAQIDLLADENGAEDITGTERSWSAKSGELFTWRPTVLSARWVWDFQTGDWRLTHLMLNGLRLKKDGSVGQRSERKELIGGYSREKVWAEDTPAYVRELVERFHPQSYVGALD